MHYWQGVQKFEMKQYTAPMTPATICTEIWILFGRLPRAEPVTRICAFKRSCCLLSVSAKTPTEESANCLWVARGGAGSAGGRPRPSLAFIQRRCGSLADVELSSDFLQLETDRCRVGKILTRGERGGRLCWVISYCAGTRH